MAEEEVTRRLTTVVAADVAGYSRLMGADDEGTLAALRNHRRELIDPEISDHGGRIANTAGDSILIEFPSVVEAMRCTLNIQRSMAERNRRTPEDRRIEFRVGINVGDIMEHKGDLLGDGVNVAARLEGLAKPGGICISARVREDVQDRLEVGFEDLGEQTLKNIARPIHVYEVLLENTEEVVTEPPKSAARSSRNHAAIFGLLVFAALSAGGLLWWQPWLEQQMEAVPVESALPLPDKPSIAVLPFQNMSGDPDQAYFSDGMAEDIITDLSKLSGLFVISRNSSFQYRGDSVDVKKVGRELGVKYVLEGSVRRAGDQVRINAQLIDALTGGHLWAERYDGNLDNVFAAQDQVTLRIVEALSVRLAPNEEKRLKRHGTDNALAYDAYLKGWAHFQKETPEDYTRANAYFEAALKLDPGYQRAHAAIASLNYEAMHKEWLAALGAVEAVELQLARKEHLAAVTEPDSVALRLRARITRIRDEDFDTAIALSREAIALTPNDADASVALARNLIFADRASEAIPLINKAIRLNPRHSDSYKSELVLALFLTDDWERAARIGQEAIGRNPNLVEIYATVISALGHLGKKDAAAPVISALQNQRARLGREPYFPKEVRRLVFANPNLDKKLYDGLIKAGLRKFIDWDAVDAATPLSREQARVLLAGHEIAGYQNQSGAGFSSMILWRRRFDNAGVIHSQYYGRETTGRYRIEDEKVCTSWKGGDADCWKISRYPASTPGYRNDYIGIDDDGIIWTFSVVR